ncbi:lysosomal alpha-glucosidase-like isoform X2 [Lycorma delicatula]|uniref:lysosomal alpha-glucosidase-like isoform X2 n=1 Tax=Lycorma delicatula TaxID=130591 RepID=UPI003F5113F7
MAALNLNENKDVQWNDIDYVVRRNDFTYDKVNFKGLDKFVDDLHKKGMHYFVIMDPGVSGREPNGTYSPYDDVIAQDILMKDFTGNKPLIGRVWNDKSTVFPDYTNPETVKYWMEQISRQQREQF